MNLFFYLLLTHLVADYPLQSSGLIKFKLKTYWGVLIHCLIHLGVLVAILHPFLHLQRIWVGILAIFITHNVIDEIKVVLDRRHPQWHVWLYFLDQVAHVVIVAFVTLYLGKISPETLLNAFYTNPTYVFYALALVLSTYFYDVTRYFLRDHKGEMTYRRDYKMIFQNAAIVTVMFGTYWVI